MPKRKHQSSKAASARPMPAPEADAAPQNNSAETIDDRPSKADAESETEAREEEEADGQVQESDSVEGEAEETENAEEHAVESSSATDATSQQPPLPQEDIPPLPDEAPPDDGWDPVWDPNVQAFYFYNRITQKTQWENPRIPQVSSTAPPGLGAHDRSSNLETTAADAKRKATSGYNPAIHGDFDPNADYAQVYNEPDEDEGNAAAVVTAAGVGSYEAAGAFNRFTGRWQAAEINPDNHNDENKSKRQMNAFFDVDAAANSHDGKSLKAERQNKRFSKKEIKAFREKRRDRKEEKRRAWLRD